MKLIKLRDRYRHVTIVTDIAKAVVNTLIKKTKPCDHIFIEVKTRDITSHEWENITKHIQNELNYTLENIVTNVSMTNTYYTYSYIVVDTNIPDDHWLRQDSYSELDTVERV